MNFSDGATYRIKNANSGLYMEVAGAKAENNTNIDQWGSDGSEIHNIWKFTAQETAIIILLLVLEMAVHMYLTLQARKPTTAQILTSTNGTRGQVSSS